MPITPHLLVAVIIASLAMSPLRGETKKPSGARDPEKRRDIRFQDLKNNFRLLGRLGKPFGEYVSVRGVWRSSSFSPKFMLFHITNVDGRNLEKPIVYPRMHVYADGSVTYFHKTPAFESVHDSEVWEMRVYERLMSFGTIPRFHEESGRSRNTEMFPSDFPSGSSDVPFELTSRISYSRPPKKSKTDQPIGRPMTPGKEPAVAAVAKDLQFETLRDRYRIIGMLGKPIGEYSTIRGKWRIETKDRKHTITSFHISHIDGRKLKRPIVHPGDIYPFSGDGNTLDDVDPHDSDIWEFRVVESVLHYGTPRDSFAEGGLVGANVAPFELTSRLIYHRPPTVIKQ